MSLWLLLEGLRKMDDFGEKILKIVLGEVLGAIFFIVLLVVASILPHDEISSQIMKIIISLWAIYGIGTPIVILTELEDEIFGVLGRLK